MFILNQIISYIFYNLGYLVITPKMYSFGGFYLTIIHGFKLSKQKNKKSIFAIPIINLSEKNFINIYHIDLTKKIFKDYSFFEKIFCLIITIYLNLNILALLFLKKILFKKYNSKYIDLIFSDYIGYADRHDKKFDFFLKKLNIDKNKIVKEKIDLSNLYNNYNNKSICFCIKDNNYEKIKEISNTYTSDISQCRKSLDYLMNKNFEVKRVGENLMNEFNFTHKNYHDLCYKKNSNDLFNKTLAGCEFYFGSSSSMGTSPEIFNKKKFIINEYDHLDFNLSQKITNFIIFKKVYCSKTNKIFKINELFEKKLFSYKDVNKGINDKMIYTKENTELEIFEGLVEFYEFNFKNKKNNFLLNNKYLEMRDYYLNKFYYELDMAYYKNYTCTIPESYLSKYLI